MPPAVTDLSRIAVVIGGPCHRAPAARSTPTGARLLALPPRTQSREGQPTVDAAGGDVMGNWESLSRDLEVRIGGSGGQQQFFATAALANSTAAAAD
ncbi:hypothetical protein KRM28CT15_04940 [Krasilnikovia sp. M28-CT-15]